GQSHATEFPLYTDARLTGDAAEFGPYQFFNLVAHPTEYGVAKVGIVVRMESFLTGPLLEVKPERDDDLYHGGWIRDELAALVSLCLGIRAKPGALSRDFARSDPRGRPVGWERVREPILSKNLLGQAIPRAAKE